MRLKLEKSLTGEGRNNLFGFSVRESQYDYINDYKSNLVPFIKYY